MAVMQFLGYRVVDITGREPIILPTINVASLFENTK